VLSNIGVGVEIAEVSGAMGRAVERGYRRRVRILRGGGKECGLCHRGELCEMVERCGV
jgi:hypothetical protein